MLDIGTIRLVSGILAFVGFLGVLASARGRRGSRPQRGAPARGSRPTGTVLHEVWLIAILLPFLFFVFGAVVPSWIYGTPLNLEFAGGEALQWSAVAIWFVGGALFVWSARALGRFLLPEIVVLEDHELVTRGPYARIRHPTYTALSVMAAAAALLYLNVVLIVDAAIVLAIAVARARREEELLGSPEGFGDRYRAYVARTGRFLPRWR